MSFFVITILFLFAFLYGLRHETKTKHYVIGLVLGWFMSLSAFILYLSSQNYYYNVLNNLFHINKQIWNQLTLAGLNRDFMIRLLNVSICTLAYCTLFYALSYSKLFSSTLKKYHVKQISIVVLFLEFLLFDPILYTRGFLSSDTWLTASQLFIVVNRIASPVFRVVNMTFGIASIVILFYHYISVPKLAYFKKMSLYNFLIIGALEIMNLFLFFWTPMLLVKASRLTGYYSYMVPDLTQSLMVMKFAPYISLILLCLVFYFSYRYTSVLKENKNIEVSITQNMDTAALGMRIFSHSIKNQLLAIRSEAEYLEELTMGNEEATYSLKLMKEACRNAFDCLDIGYDILRARHIQLKYASVEDPIQSAINNSQQIDPEILITLSTHITTPNAYLDHEHLEEVFSNLLQNAIDAIHHTTDGRKGLILISIDAQANWLTVSIEDNGCGMDAEHCEKIFNPFFSTKASISNWGIGLSFCQRIINAHSGKIIVTSKPNIGTTFHIVLPITHEGDTHNGT